MTDVVSIVESSENIESMLRYGLDLIGDFVLDGLPIIIKPNLCTETDKLKSGNTDIETVKSVLNILLKKDQDAKIQIVESDSAGKWLDRAFQINGYIDMLEEYRENGYNIELINLSKETDVTSIYQSESIPDIRIPKLLLEPNFFISIARAKTHSFTDITGILKNQFGCVSRKDKGVYHKFIDKTILEINRNIKPDLCIVNATTGTEGVIGKTRPIGVLLFGYMPVSVDSVMAKVMGFTPDRINHIALASSYGLGSMHPKIIGLPMDKISVKFPKPNKIVKIVNLKIPDGLRPIARRIYENLHNCS